jgi:ankyrin repeat protein
MLLFVLPFSIGCTMKKRSPEYNPEIYFSETELPLGRAISEGNGSELKRLIKQGNVDINKPGKEGYTYLLYAIQTLSYDMVKILLENGADPNILSPRTYVPGAGNQSKPENKACIETVCYSRYNIKYLKLLVKYGANINDKRVGAPLSQAIFGDQTDKIDFLLKNGADVNIVAIEGLPPLITAADLGRFELVERFLDLGADPFIEIRGLTLQESIQYNIESSEGHPKNKELKRKLIRRLEAQGIKFDFSKAKFKMQD